MRAFGLGIALLTMALMPATFAGETAKKVPNPLKTLKKVHKNVSKETTKGSFGVSCSVRGGTTRDGKNHTVSMASVAQDYTAKVNRNIMYNEALDAYRNARNGKGAIRNERNFWQATIANQQGVLFERLMEFPHQVISHALENPKNIEWVWVGDELAKEETEVEKEDTEGHTTVVKRKERVDGWKGMPHMMRVTLNPKVALRQFEQTINSNCVGGG